VEHLDTYHASLEQAVNSTPEAADTGFYRPGTTNGAARVTPPVHQPDGKAMTSNDNPGPASRPDPLRIANRLVLADGEQFAGSGSVKDDEGALLLAVAVDTPDGRQVHIGVPINEEDRKNWRGAHAPQCEVQVDEEDGEEYGVDTGSDVTAVLDAADVARLPEVAADLIARATETDKEYKALVKQWDRLYTERARLEARRFGSPDEGQRAMDADANLKQAEQTQRSRRRDMDAAVDRLPPQDRARYDEIQQQIDAAGSDAWEPGREAEAAAVCGLTVPEFTELRALSRLPWRQRTAAQTARHDELKYGAGSALHPVLPPLLAEQAAIVCGLTVPQYREMQALESIPKALRYAYLNRSRVRTPQEQARLDELDTAPGGAAGATDRQTYKLRGRYVSMQRTHHSSKFDVAERRETVAAIDATARPLEPGEAAELQRITTELDAVAAKTDAMGGYASATAEIPARNGGALLIEAMQKEEDGGVEYRLARKPADADDDWSPAQNGDPYCTTAAGLRKVAKVAATLAGS
jgi:hypothetical protein